MDGREECCERHWRWLLAVALLAGGAGIGFGGALAALLADRGVSALLWVSVLGRLVATAGIVFAWSSLEVRPATVRVLLTRLDRLASAYRTQRVRGSRPLSRSKWGRSATGFYRLRSRVARLRSPSKNRGGRRRRRARGIHPPGPSGRALADRLRGALETSEGRWRKRPGSGVRSRLRSPLRARSDGGWVRERVGTLLSRASIGRV